MRIKIIAALIDSLFRLVCIIGFITAGTYFAIMANINPDRATVGAFIAVVCLFLGGRE